MGGGGLPFNFQLFKALLHPLVSLLKNIPRVYGLHANCLLKFLANTITYYRLLGSAALWEPCPPWLQMPSLLFPSHKLYLQYTLLHIFQSSQSRSSPCSTSPHFTVRFPNCPSLIHSYHVSNPLQPLLKISANMSRSVYSSLNSWLVLILHINCSTASPYILLNIFPLPCISLFISISVTAYDLKWLPYAILYAECLSYSCLKFIYPHYSEAL